MSRSFAGYVCCLLAMNAVALAGEGPAPNARAQAQQIEPGKFKPEYPMPKRDEYFKIYREYMKLSKAGKDIPKALRERYWAARKAMNKELAALNNRIYEARHAAQRKNTHAPVLQGRKLGLDAITYPRVNGSTSAHPLAMTIACRLLEAEYEWTKKHPSYYSWGGYTPWGVNPEFRLAQYRLLAARKPVEKARLGGIINTMIAVHSGTHGAYMTLLGKQADLILVARKPSADELKAATKANVEFDVRPVALDAFVFIVHRSNMVRNLSTDQLKKVYTGKIRNWKNLGGTDNPIQPYQRNRNSGSQVLMQSVFMKGKPVESRLDDKTWVQHIMLQGMGGPYNRLSRDTFGLAYSVYFYEHFMAGSPYTCTLAVDGVQPTYETISSGKYPYVTKVYVVVRKDQAADTHPLKLRDWLLSKEGQQVVRESGYVPLPVKKDK